LALSAAIKAALWRSAFTARTEVLALRHHVLSRRKAHHALLNRAFQTALDVARHLLDIARNLSARAITVLNSLLTARIGAAIKVRALLVRAATKQFIHTAFNTVALAASTSINVPLSIGPSVQINTRNCATISGTTVYLGIPLHARPATNIVVANLGVTLRTELSSTPTRDAINSTADLAFNTRSGLTVHTASASTATDSVIDRTGRSNVRV
jgi:hypothetical protein